MTKPELQIRDELTVLCARLRRAEPSLFLAHHLPQESVHHANGRFLERWLAQNSGRARSGRLQRLERLSRWHRLAADLAARGHSCPQQAGTVERREFS